MIKSKWRMGFIALRNIPLGEELCYDYGVRGRRWLGKSKLTRSKVVSSAEVKEMEDVEVVEVVV